MSSLFERRVAAVERALGEANVQNEIMALAEYLASDDRLTDPAPDSMFAHLPRLDAGTLPVDARDEPPPAS